MTAEITHELNLEYRFIERNDIPSLAELRMEYFRETNNKPLPDEIMPNTIRYLKEELASGALTGQIAVLNGRIIAVGLMSVFNIMPTRRNPTGKRGYLFDFYVKPEFRRRRIATTILHQLKDEAWRIGVHDLFLNAREMAIPLYEQNGFQFLRHEMRVEL